MRPNGKFGGRLIRVNISIDQQLSAIRRGVVDLVNEAELRKKLERSAKTGKPLRVKLGVDPSSPDLHLGHTIPLWKLRTFQDLGHQAVLIIGDGTGRIGDPTGRNKTRPQLTKEDVTANAKTYLAQAGKVLDMKKTEIVHNGDWFEKMDFFATVKLASRMTVARMLERDYFAERWKAGVEIRIHEMLYPLMQGWDSVMVKSDVELGGTDQLFNLLVGRDFQEQEGQEAQICITTPLLEGTDGRKMSKSYENSIGIAESPKEMFGKSMSIADNLMGKYFTLLTQLPDGEIQSLLQGHPREAKVRLAKEIVAVFHSRSEADAQAEEFDRIFKNKEKPTDMPEFRVASPNSVVEVILLCKFASSKGEARRLIQQGGVRLDDKTVENGDEKIPFPAAGSILQVGKRRFAKILPS